MLVTWVETGEDSPCPLAVIQTVSFVSFAQPGTNHSTIVHSAKHVNEAGRREEEVVQMDGDKDTKEPERCH